MVELTTQLWQKNHRIIRFEMVVREWGFQYSPYAYL